MMQSRPDSAPHAVVVPRPLAGHFYERLQRLYEDRTDVVVIVDRRRGERRRSPGRGSPGGAERRRSERRVTAAAWSLPDLPVRR
ncbi:MAG: hypothetical protein FJ000_09420, partial [Actinobacteria bacterium]|nr:hypothetical protein [Actinomycetota bacterium]